MYRVFGFLQKLPHLSMAEFIDHYETRHIPLVLSLAGQPPVYKRRYIDRDKPTTKGAGTVDFDAMTELAFEDRTAFAAWMARLYGPSAEGKVVEDEKRFLDMAKTRGYVVQEFGAEVSP